MNSVIDILELDYTPAKKWKNLFYSILVHVSLIILFTTLSSYQIPQNRVNQNNEHLQTFIELQISSIVDISFADSSNNLNNQINQLLVQFYENRNYKPAWINNIQLSDNFYSYLNLLDSAKYYGFPFDYFGKEQIKKLTQEVSTKKQSTELLKNLIQIEFTTTYSAFKYLIYLNRGIIEQDTTQSFKDYLSTLPEFINNTIEWFDLKKEFLSNQPDLVHHHNILKSLPYFIDLHYSIKYTTPAFIDDQLLAKGLYYAGIAKKTEFTDDLKTEALFALQDQYNLPHDSILNKETQEVLVSLLKEKYYQACLNLHRLRRLNHSGENYLFVNIPEFKLHVIESSEIKEVFNVIVGKKQTPTPTLTSSIEKVVTNPYWTVPKSISYGMFPKIRKDSTYLKRNGYFVINNYEQIVDESEIDWSQPDPLGNKYWIRQINSSVNALGQVKFMFPNNYSVYLHDTPAKQLFKNENRTYSHGCVRLENPDKLAQYISDKFYDKEDLNIQNLISQKELFEIELSEKLEIHIQYITCSGDENADMVFYNDIYNLDKKELMEVFPEQSEI